MGTNFFLLTGKKPKEYSWDSFRYSGNFIHIGKRSAAGHYCWDCHRTLCMPGESRIHTSRDDEWVDACPICKKPIETKANVVGQSVALELGFSKPAMTQQSGVKCVSSFTWASPESMILDLRKSKKKLVVDEYHRESTVAEFLQMLEHQCPIRYYHSIGQEFS